MAAARPPVLEVSGLHVSDDRGAETVAGVDLSVAAGEIACVVGVEGNGQSEFIEAIAGLREIRSGSIRVDGNDITALDVFGRRRRYLAHIPEDRLYNGIAGEATVAENMLLGFQRDSRFRSGAFLKLDAINGFARRLIEDFDIRAHELNQPAGQLSGGNIQRLIVAREAAHDVPLILVSQPTRGVDIRAITTIHEALRRLCKDGRAILVVTSDLDEAMAIGDEVFVFFRGRVALRGRPRTLGYERLGLAMSGAA